MLVLIKENACNLWPKISLKFRKSFEIFKILAPQVENPNAPNPYGWTSLQVHALSFISTCLKRDLVIEFPSLMVGA